MRPTDQLINRILGKVVKTIVIIIVLKHIYQPRIARKRWFAVKNICTRKIVADNKKLLFFTSEPKFLASLSAGN